MANSLYLSPQSKQCSSTVQFSTDESSVTLYGRRWNFKVKEKCPLTVLHGCSDRNNSQRLAMIHVRMINGSAYTPIISGNRNLESPSYVDPHKQDFSLCMAAILGQSSLKNTRETFGCYNQMPWQNVKPNSVIFVALIKACSCGSSLLRGRQMHARVIETALELNIFIGCALINMYARLFSLLDALIVFNKLPMRNVVVWNAMITGFVQHECVREAFIALREMKLEDVEPDEVTFICILKGCASISAYQEGREIHACIIENGFILNVTVCNSLIDMYFKTENLEDGLIVFDSMSIRNVVTWNTLISAYIRHNYFNEAIFYVRKMQDDGFKLDSVTFLSILQIYSNMGSCEQVEQVHSAIVASGFEGITNVGNAVINMYAKCGELHAAHNMFNKKVASDVVAWTSLITGYAQNGFHQEAFEYFKCMQLEGIMPHKSTFLSMLKVCATPAGLEQGRNLHAQLIELGIEHDLILANTMIDMYGKCRSFEGAYNVFNKLSGQDDVSCNALIGAFSECCHCEEVVDVFKQLQSEGFEPSTTTFVYVLKACRNMTGKYQGLYIHALIIENGFEANVYIGSALVGMYAGWGCLKDAYRVFRRIPKVDVVTWTTLMAGYIDQDYCIEALQLFQSMQEECLEVTPISISCALRACTNMAALEKGRKLHVSSIEYGMETALVGSALIDMYTKCGNLDMAEKVFNRIGDDSLLTWNSLIGSYAQHGDHKKASELFLDMQQHGLKPNQETFLRLMCSCRRIGLINESCVLLKSMQDLGISPTIRHYNFMVELLGHEGLLDEALDLLESIPLMSDVVGWTSLLSSCRKNGSVLIGRLCFDRFVLLERNNAAAFTLMCSIYANSGMKKEAQEVEELRNIANAWKKPGKAYIEINEEIHCFNVDDRSHPKKNAIYAKLRGLNTEMEDHRYKPLANFQENNEMEDNPLCGHCEKLAIAFGLISSPQGTTLRVSKNLRMCTDCHLTSKLISKIEMREIIVTDACCIHHFQGGTCSCNDDY